MKKENPDDRKKMESLRNHPEGNLNDAFNRAFLGDTSWTRRLSTKWQLFLLFLIVVTLTTMYLIF